MTVAACMALVRKRHSSLELKYEELARHKNGRKSLSMGARILEEEGQIREAVIAREMLVRTNHFGPH